MASCSLSDAGLTITWNVTAVRPELDAMVAPWPAVALCGGVRRFICDVLRDLSKRLCTFRLWLTAYSALGVCRESQTRWAHRIARSLRLSVSCVR